MRTVAIVGSSLAGLRAAETFRREGFDGRIVAIGAEPHLPYDRPPLSKEFLRGDWEPEQLVLRKQGVDDLDLDWRLFLFQAEDGIRAGRVTGVQTCALPISLAAAAARDRQPGPRAPPRSPAPQ